MIVFAVKQYRIEDVQRSFITSAGKTFNEGCHGIDHDLDDHGQG